MQNLFKTTNMKQSFFSLYSKDNGHPAWEKTQVCQHNNCGGHKHHYFFRELRTHSWAELYSIEHKSNYKIHVRQAGCLSSLGETRDRLNCIIPKACLYEPIKNRAPSFALWLQIQFLSPHFSISLFAPSKSVKQRSYSHCAYLSGADRSFTRITLNF